MYAQPSSHEEFIGSMTLNWKQQELLQVGTPSLKEVMLIHNMNYVCWITVLSCMSVVFANTIFLSNSLQFHQTSLKLPLNLLTWRTWTSFAAEVL